MHQYGPGIQDFTKYACEFGIFLNLGRAMFDGNEVIVCLLSDVISYVLGG